MRINSLPLLVSLLLLTCTELPLENNGYEKKLVMFANLDANGYMDTCYVSYTSEFSENTDFRNLYVADATISLTDNSTGQSYPVDMVYPGRYINSSVLISPGTEYTIEVSYGDDYLSASTTTPDKLEFESINGQYDCGVEIIDVPSVNINNWDYETDGIIDGAIIDTIEYSMQDCYIGSFASAPYFYLDFNTDDYSAINTVTYALETDSFDIEWEYDLDQNGIIDDDEYIDYNSNGVRDSSFTNVIYSDSFLYGIWKGPYYRDENNNPYLPNPFAWTVETSPLPMMWLYFNYYGLQKIKVQAMSEDYYNYKAGLTSDNPFLLPTSNIDNGYGLLSSTYSKSFFIYIKNPFDTGQFEQ